jgi:hypothetical protein
MSENRLQGVAANGKRMKICIYYRLMDGYIDKRILGLVNQ